MIDFYILYVKKTFYIMLLCIFVMYNSVFASQDRESGANSLPSFSFVLDLPLLVFSSGAGVWGAYLLSSKDIPETIPEKSDLYMWDRPFAGTYSKKMDLASDVLNTGLIVPILLTGSAFYNDEINGSEFAGALTMYVEALALQSGINLLVRSSQIWPRPYVYGSEKKTMKGEAYGSFYSGHVSAMFTSAVFSTYFFDSVYPNSAYFWPVAIGSFSMASLMAVLRIGAGKHYPTDVVVGALAGTAISLSVIEIHSFWMQRVRVVASPNYVGTIVLF